jgi:group I intron endonuclease
MNKPGIYLIRNRVNNKIYIGSSYNINKRLNNHKSKLRRNQHKNIHLQNAWNLYGEDNFVFVVLELVDDINILSKIEQKYLDSLLYANENDDRFYELGYNTRRNAENNKGHKFSPETILKLKQSHTGKKNSEDTKRKMSEAQKGEKNSFYGKKHTEEMKKKQSERYRGRSLSEETKKAIKLSMSKPVNQFSLDGTFIKRWDSSKEAKLFLGIGHIDKVCRGERKTAGKFIWKWD